MWGNPPGVAVTEIGLKKILFSFKDRKKRAANTSEWIVEFHGILVDYMSKETTIYIGNMFGVVAEVENPKVDGVLRRFFLRIRIGINITKALPTGFWNNKEKLSENNERRKKEKYKQDYKAESGDIYYVKLANDGEEEGGKMVENNRGSSGWKIELANCMQQSLKLKKKREDRRILQIVGAAWKDGNEKDPVQSR
ncbi:hypothetical protein Ahy_B08g093457 [Arachis hypogaea]|uniref:DUF4283 domain-containing protein n=1 Tax=Arachis hypogaea TaxID=3818 RepID=A0A444Y665_ARAHY|nr:hypothetical protein Ahy_B08g093457 [Arachis hypogaea]